LLENIISETNAGTKKQKATAANDIWRKFLKIVNRNNLDLITVKQTLNGAGEVLFETKKRLPQEKEYSVDGMIIDKITTNPHGGEWITYKNQTKQNSESTLVLVQKLIDSHFINGNANRELKIDNIIFNTSSPEPSFFGVQDEVEYVNKKIAVVNLI
jgi:hypothetical protein